MSNFPTITEAEQLLPKARAVADKIKANYDDAPLSLGFMSLKSPPESAFDKGRELAEKYGW